MALWGASSARSKLNPTWTQAYAETQCRLLCDEEQDCKVRGGQERVLVNEAKQPVAHMFLGVAWFVSRQHSKCLHFFAAFWRHCAGPRCLYQCEMPARKRMLLAVAFMHGCCSYPQMTFTCSSIYLSTSASTSYPPPPPPKNKEPNHTYLGAMQGYYYKTTGWCYRMSGVSSFSKPYSTSMQACRVV